MIRIVVDTNVWISALVLEGDLHRLFELSDSAFEICISVPLLDEFHRVARDKFHKTAGQLEGYRQTVLEFAKVIDVTKRINALNYDPDNRVLECAVASSADVIVTGDKKHLLPLKEFKGILIESPAQFLERFNS